MLDKIMAKNERMEAAAFAAIPMRRLGESQDIAQAALWICSDRASPLSMDMEWLSMAA